jgi:hypothetical protein
MSLMQMLTASKSVLNIKDEPSRYRMSQRKLLPKFGPVPKTEAENRVAPPEEGRTEKKKDLIVKDTTENAGKRERFIARWFKLANPFARRAAAAPAKPPVQSELHLDGVKPVRNDLHETDLMVVRRQPLQKPVAEPGSDKEQAAAKEPSGLIGKQ